MVPAVSAVEADPVGAPVDARPTPVLTVVPCGAAAAPIVGNWARKSVELGAWMLLRARCVLPAPVPTNLSCSGLGISMPSCAAIRSMR